MLLPASGSPAGRTVMIDKALIRQYDLNHKCSIPLQLTGETRMNMDYAPDAENTDQDTEEEFLIDLEDFTTC